MDPVDPLVHAAMERALGDMAQRVAELREAERQVDRALKLVQRRAKGYILEVIQRHGGEMTNAELGWYLGSVLGKVDGERVASQVYELAKDGVLIGRKESRPTKAGKMMKQRIWYLEAE